jgi:MoxR-like ATPase
METSSMERLTERVREASGFVSPLVEAIRKVIVGQELMVERLLVGLLTRGHVLLEGVPGLAKTLTVNTLARSIGAGFRRIQFTPDLLPADLIGTLVYNPRSGEFTVKKGPLFTNIVLADEVNRAPAKVQSALLEAMQERQVTIGDETWPLEEPFLVLATQNPIETEGTYALPEAQVDRFMLKIKVSYPGREEEVEIMRRMAARHRPELQPVVSLADIRRVREVADAVYLDPKVEEYILDVVLATRQPSAFRLERLETLIEYGASPRATIYLAQAAKVHAFMEGRTYVTPQDVKTIGPDVLRHRVLLSYEAEAQDLDSDSVLRDIFNTVDVP